MAAFKNYSGGGSTSSNYSQETNYSANSTYNQVISKSPTNYGYSGLSNQYGDSNTLQVNRQDPPMQHSLSANELMGQGFKREEPAAMFKKKQNNYEL